MIRNRSTFITVSPQPQPRQDHNTMAPQKSPASNKSADADAKKKASAKSGTKKTPNKKSTIATQFLASRPRDVMYNSLTIGIHK